MKVANGRARIVDEETNAKLEVSFFGPFWGDYWVIGLARRIILSRWLANPPGGICGYWRARRAISDEVRDGALNDLKSMGYNTDALYWTEQPPAN